MNLENQDKHISESKYYFEYLKRTERFPQSVYHKAKHKMVCRMISSVSLGGKILDAACGIGNITGKYCNKYNITGIDEQTSALSYATQNYKGKYVHGSLYKLPFEDNSFDLILFLDAIEHFSDPVKALQELSRVLRPEGRILICTINYANPLWWILENTWHRFLAGNCKTYSREVHPTRYTEDLLRTHCAGLFEEDSLEKHIMKMELFYIGKKKRR